MSHERWDLLLGDAENFLTQWGSTASALGWVALDLYGVHPVAPAARFDVMGFLPFPSSRRILRRSIARRVRDSPIAENPISRMQSYSQRC
jgi:hypothetical protein